MTAAPRCPPASPFVFDYAGFIGRSAVMQQVYRGIAAAAPLSYPVFISGETGTGKDLTARALHNHSGRAAQPFIVLNCAALPRDLVESEIFGHRRGAFTGAAQDHTGAVARAEGGTLFLDEITEMPAALQAKLLRVVETGVYTPLGESRERQAQVRILAASNRPLADARRDGLLREDLYHRLAGIEIALPPLRLRGAGDIDLLCTFFLEKIAAQSGLSLPAVTDAARARFSAHAWPGNLRQLENTLRQIMVLQRPCVIDDHHLPAEETPVATAMETLAAAEARLIGETITRHRGNLAAAARTLGIDVSTLHRKRRRGQIG